MKNDLLTYKVITVVLLIVLVGFMIMRRSSPVPLSIQEKAELLHVCGYDIDCNAVEHFAQAWDEYVESVGTELAESSLYPGIEGYER